MNGTYLSVEPHLVEHGDIIVGLHTPITSILTDGVTWWFGGDTGTFLTKRLNDEKVQVLRGQDVAEVSGIGNDPATATGAVFPPTQDEGTPPPLTSDDAPPHGYTRPRARLMVVPLP